ncbi:UNVERIFIED_CONTAM: Pentatricopeptide repeat-containing protein [Sesamum radiatum]|uniref:Pentatricopeptide repeat-containing protein n=1 Tax=Sesamum radiatum TaxID=300843 RepID=A0AAW2NCR6_SESRA
MVRQFLSVVGRGGENGVYRKEKGKKNGYVRKLGGCVENYGKHRGDMGSGSVVEEMKTKCSTKWARYGGCIPAMLEALETVNDLDEALKPWERTLTNKERSILLQEQLGWERALEIFEWFKMKRCYEVNVIHYNIMFKILGKARQRFRDLAIKWLELMNKSGMEPDVVTMGIVVQMYKKAWDFKRAEEFFKKWSNSMVDERGSAIVWSEAHLASCKKLVRLLKECSRKVYCPTTVTFNTLIHMFGNNGLLDEVASLMQRMENDKCSPDTQTYNILISVHAKHNDIDLAARYLTKMKEASLEPDAVSYWTLLFAFSIRHMVAEAEKLISEMDERGMEIDEFTQSSLSRMYIESGMLEKSWSWFQRFHLGGNMTSECYSASTDAFGERGYILEAQKVLECCQQVKKMTILEFNVMIKAYGISKKFEQVTQSWPDGHGSWIIQEMIGHGIKPDVIVYGVLINAFANTGSVNEATYYVDAMRNLGLPMNCVICKSLIKLYTKVGYLKEAQQAYEMLRSFGGLDVSSSNCMIDLYSERSMVSEAEEIFETLKQNGDANEFSYAMMLCMYKRNGRFVEAFCIARKMRELGLMRDLLSYNHVLGLYASDKGRSSHF